MRKATNKMTGEPQDEVETIVIIPPACPTCGSTKRANFGAIQRLESAGEIRGISYTSVKWQRTNCLDCGQHYIVKTFE